MAFGSTKNCPASGGDVPKTFRRRQRPSRVSWIHWQPDSPAALAEMLRENFAGAQLPVFTLGGRHAEEMAPHPSAVLLETAQLRQVIDYPHRDMTITVQAGISLADLDQILAEHGQRLPVDAQFPERTTLGAAIASNLAGPGRYGHGTLRDYVIGISAVDGQGRLFSAGGRVVKNVAGYDLCKLLIGSAGALAVITQVSLKLKPRPAWRKILFMELSDVSRLDVVLESLNLTAARPVALDVMNSPAARRLFPERGFKRTSCLMLIALEGTSGELDWQTEQLQREQAAAGVPETSWNAGADAVNLRSSWNNFPAAHEFAATCQIRTLPSHVSGLLDASAHLSVELLAGGDGLIWGGVSGQPDAALPVEKTLMQVEEALRSVDSQASLRICSSRFPLPRELRSTTPSGNMPTELWRGIKQALDPANILRPANPWLDFLNPQTSLAGAP